MLLLLVRHVVFCSADVVPRVSLYTLESRAALQTYFDVHAARMREDGVARFGSRFTASRRVLRVTRSVRGVSSLEQ